MKFDYPEVSTTTPAPVAFIDRSGNLILPLFTGRGHAEITSHGMVDTYENISFEEEMSNAQKMFYPGDTLTITF